MPTTPERIGACRQKALQAYEDAKGKLPHELDRSLEPRAFAELQKGRQAITPEGVIQRVEQAELNFFDPEYMHFDPARNRREDYDFERMEVVYGSADGRDLCGTLYLPARREAPVPVVVHIHGGGWVAHTREAAVPYALRLTQRGIATLAIDYRLSYEAKWPACLHDSKCAVRFLRAKADTYDLDADHVGAFGTSAGAHLSGMLATTPHVRAFEGDGGHADHSSAIQAAVPIACNMDLPGLFSVRAGVPVQMLPSWNRATGNSDVGCGGSGRTFRMSCLPWKNCPKVLEAPQNPGNAAERRPEKVETTG